MKLIPAASLAITTISVSSHRNHSILATASSNAKLASEIPRIHTPSPGEWPQSDITGCGFTGLPYTNVLSECTEELPPDAPDLRGYWREIDHGGTNETHGTHGTSSGVGELIEQCGSRWIDISIPVIHDFLECTGEVGDGLGCHDYSGPDIVGRDGLCSPIVVACKFESDTAQLTADNEGGENTTNTTNTTNGTNSIGSTNNINNCINLYTVHPTTNTPTKVVSRCLQPDGSMIWIHPLIGTVRYEKVPSDEEPNCIKCVGGEYDGVTVYDSESELPCTYQERSWEQCKDIVEVEDDENVESIDNVENEDSGGGGGDVTNVETGASYTQRLSSLSFLFLVGLVQVSLFQC